MQVVMSAVLIHTLHAALENREVTFNGVGMNCRINLRNIFALTVPSETVLGKVVVCAFVLRGLISH